MVTASGFSGAEARRLLRHGRHASLATLDHDTAHPYASLVNCATDLAGRPVIFVSRLARHTQNLLSNPKGSMLVASLPAAGDVLASARVTVLGRFEPASRDELAGRYAEHHPSARMYLDFPDFSFWRLIPALAHGVAGFGRIETLPASEVFLPEAIVAGFGDLALSAQAHMNRDHAEVVRLFATRLLNQREADWRVTSIDPDGAFLQSGDDVVRLDFDSVVSSPEHLRSAFLSLAERARKM